MKKTSIALLSLGLAASAQAALINASGNATLVSSTTFASGDASGFSDNNLGDGSNGFPDTGNNGQIYTNDPGGYPSNYFENAGPIVVDLDLGDTYALDAVAFWNRGGFNNNSVQDFSVTFSTNNTFGDLDDSVTFDFTATSGVGGTQQDFALGTIVNDAQFVRVEITSNYYDVGDPLAGGDRVNLSEFQFNAIPEPSSAALLGMAGLGLVLRRRK